MLKIDIEYVLSLSTDDLRLIVSSLAQKLKPEQEQKALDLQRRLLKEKKDFLVNMVRGIDKNLHNIENGR